MSHISPKVNTKLCISLPSQRKSATSSWTKRTVCSTPHGTAQRWDKGLPLKMRLFDAFHSSLGHLRFLNVHFFSVLQRWPSCWTNMTGSELTFWPFSPVFFSFVGYHPSCGKIALNPLTMDYGYTLSWESSAELAWFETPVVCECTWWVTTTEWASWGGSRI